uniref:Uncharacterized protein n=1 Tax=Arundo donax TaxID=35708 RepID=A0A0A9BDE6_ARUDO
MPNVLREGTVSRRAIVHERPKLTQMPCINILVNLLNEVRSFFSSGSIHIFSPWKSKVRVCSYVEPCTSSLKLSPD